MKKSKILKALIFASFLATSSCGGNIDISSETSSEVTYVTLKQMKINAISELESYVSLDDYRTSEQDEIKELIETFKTTIDEIKVKEEVTSLLSSYKEKIANIKTSEYLDNQEAEIASKDYHIYNYMNKVDSYNILMLGSSYLFYFEQYKLLNSLLSAQGYKASVEAIVKSKATLQMFTETSNELYKKLQISLDSKQYDYIFLEELSTRPLKNYTLFENAVDLLVENISAKQQNCEVILFAPWARDERCSWYEDNSSYDYESMEKGLVDAYENVANKHDLRITYPGLSFKKLYQQKDNEINLYYTDYSHPSFTGAYLSSLTLFETLTGDDMETVTYYPRNYEITIPQADKFSIDETTFRILKSVVYKDKSIKELKVYAWASGASTGQSYYTEDEMEEMRLRFAKKVKKVIFKWTSLFGVNKNYISSIASTIKDADIFLAGNNMDSDCGIALNNDEAYKKALIGAGWTNKDYRYVGISSSCTNLETASLFRNMLVENYVSLDETCKVLLIGNSYTYFNDMYLMFEEICNSLNINVKAYKVTLGSRKLADYANDDDTTKELINKLDNNIFDYVVLQEHSTRPINNATLFRSGINVIKELLNNHQNSSAKLILYETWARNEGNSYYDDHYTEYSVFLNKYTAMEEDLAKSYYTEGNYFNAKVSYAGIAFYDVFVNHSEINLYHTDNTHPSACGSYLIALVHAASIFNIDPRNVSYIPSFTKFNDGGASVIMPTNEEAIILRNAAYEAVYNFNINNYFSE